MGAYAHIFLLCLDRFKFKLVGIKLVEWLIVVYKYKYLICVTGCTMCLAISELFILQQSFVSLPNVIIVMIC